MSGGGRVTGVLGIVEAGVARPVAGARRFLLDATAWQSVADRLRDDPIEVGSLWSDGEAVHALLQPEANESGFGEVVIASVAVDHGRYAALSPVRPALAPCERMIRDLWGFEAMAARDLRPLLDHGGWGCSFPMAARPGPAAYPPEPPEFPLLPEEERDDCTQLGRGPVGSPLAGPAHLRLVLEGDRLRRVDPLLGFAHRGVVSAMRGRDPAGVLRLVARIDHTIAAAASCAAAQALERVGQIPLPEPVARLRHFAVGFEAALHGLHALARLARTLRRPGPATAFDAAWLACRAAAIRVFGPGLMFDLVTLGGFAGSAEADRLEQLREPLAAAATVLARHGETVRDAAGAGPVGRATEERLRRVWSAVTASRDRLRETAIAGSGAAPALPTRLADGEAIGAAMSGRGPVFCWLRLCDGVVTAFHLVDPGLARAERWRTELPGLRLHQLEAACAAADLSVPGLDQ